MDLDSDKGHHDSRQLTRMLGGGGGGGKALNGNRGSWWKFQNISIVSVNYDTRQSLPHSERTEESKNDVFG